MLDVSIVPVQYKEKDPRTLLYHYPNMPTIVYAKKMQKFAFYQSLEVAENIAHRLGYLLVPSSCFHWQRIKTLREQQRKIKVGRNSFFLVRDYEMSNNEKKKFTAYLDAVKNESEG